MIVAKQRLQLSVNKSMFGAVVGLFRREWPLLARDNILCLALYMLSPVHRSIYLSVCLSVTRVDQSKMAEVRVTQSLADRTIADRTNGRAIATVLRLSSVVCPSVTLCIVAKRCVLEQKLLLRAYRKSYVRNRLVPK